MSGNGEVDQCPFCNAAWGDCLHVKLLADLDCEAAARSIAALTGSTSSVNNVNTPAKKAACAAKAIPQARAHKTILRSR